MRTAGPFAPYSESFERRATLSCSISFSKSRTRRISAGSFGNAAVARSHVALSNAGEPDMTAPGRMS